jgi:hypothetical protein
MPGIGALNLARHVRRLVGVPGEDDDHRLAMIDAIGNRSRPGYSRRNISWRHPAGNTRFFQLRADKLRPGAVVLGVADEYIFWHYSRTPFA